MIIKTTGLRGAIIVCLLLIMPFAMQAQKKGYVSTNENVYQQGRISFDPRVPGEVVIEITRSERITYTPADLKEFGFIRFLGFGDSTIYEPAVIPINDTDQNVFLERLAGKEHKLLEFEGSPNRLFYKHQDELVELTKSNYKAILNRLSAGQPAWLFQTARVKFNSLHLAQFFNTLQYGRGAQLNINKGQIQISTISGNMNLGNLGDANSPFTGRDIAVSEMGFGLSYYVPFAESNRWGLTSELSYERFQVIDNAQFLNQDQDILVGFDRVFASLAPTLRLFEGPVSVFAFGGGSASFAFADESTVYQASTDNNNQITFFTIENPVEQESLQLGYLFGLGLDYYVKSGIMTSLTYSYGNSINNSGDIQALNNHRFTLKIGL